jgi:hypothetical protein
MSKHEEVEVNSDKPYEVDVLNFRGIIYFCVGLTLLIVVTFGLMWIFQYKVLQPQAEQSEYKNPMAMTEEERLPPEPRLQSAPGFGVDSKDGRVVLELREPQAEMKELQKQYKDIWENGEKGKDGKTVISLPIEDAKAQLLKDGSIKAKSGKEGERALSKLDKYISGSSAGRSSAKRR